jgi:fructokinase
VIVVAGEALIDLLAAPDGRVEHRPGGGPFNVARTIGRLGVGVSFVGRLSRDDAGRRLRALLAADGVDIGSVVETDDPTTTAVAVLDEAGVATWRFETRRTSAPGLRPADLPAIGDAIAIHVGTLGLVFEPLADAVEALMARTSSSTLVALDVNARPAAIADPARWAARVERIARRADVVNASVPDLTFWDASAHGRHADGDAAAVAAELLGLGPRVVLVTDGANPARIVTRRGTTMLAAPRVEVVDTVGAGDAFAGGFLATWIGEGRRGGAELDDDQALAACVRRALLVAGLTCTRRGAEPPTASELASAELGG